MTQKFAGPQPAGLSRPFPRLLAPACPTAPSTNSKPFCRGLTAEMASEEERKAAEVQVSKEAPPDASVPAKPRSGATLWAVLRPFKLLLVQSPMTRATPCSEKHRGSLQKKQGLRGRWAKLLDDENLKAPPTWEERFLVLLSFRKRFGHCDVPPDFKVQWLAAWVVQQRAEYDLFACCDPRTDMTEEQVRLLTDAGFDWEGQPPITFTSGRVAIAFGANGWEHVGDGTKELRDANVKIEQQHEQLQRLISQLRTSKLQAKALKEGIVLRLASSAPIPCREQLLIPSMIGRDEAGNQAVEELHAENIVLREANAKLLETLAIARLDESKSHDAYLRQKLQIRGYKAELLRCYNLLRASNIDPTPSDLLDQQQETQLKYEDDAKLSA
eukprot:scaffold4027_cov245-Pinguiococcus_pyrenoidosus.AAC.4